MSNGECRMEGTARAGWRGAAEWRESVQGSKLKVPGSRFCSCPVSCFPCVPWSNPIPHSAFRISKERPIEMQNAEGRMGEERGAARGLACTQARPRCRWRVPSPRDEGAGRGLGRGARLFSGFLPAHPQARPKLNVLLEIRHALQRRTGCVKVLRQEKNQRFVPPDLEQLQDKPSRPSGE